MSTIFLITFYIINQIQNKLYIIVLHLILYTLEKSFFFLLFWCKLWSAHEQVPKFQDVVGSTIHEK